MVFHFSDVMLEVLWSSNTRFGTYIDSAMKNHDQPIRF